MDVASARSLLDRLRAGDVLWLMHVNADADCVGSAHALQHAFGGTVGAPEGMSRAGRRLAERLGLKVDEWPHPEHYAEVVAVDTSSRSQLGRLGGRVKAPLLVDHHRYGDLQEGAPALAWDPTRTSCAEVVLELLDEADRPPAGASALGLLAGILADTKRLRLATPATLRATARLLEAAGDDVTLEDVERLVAEDEDEDAHALSRRIATLTAGQRAQVERINDRLLVTSHVSSHDALAAGALVRAGADVALVVSERSQAARMTMRASPDALAAGLDLGLVANEAAREVGWSGGGHPGAAGLNGKPPAEPARAATLRRLRTWLEGPP